MTSLLWEILSRSILLYLAQISVFYVTSCKTVKVSIIVVTLVDCFPMLGLYIFASHAICWWVLGQASVDLIVGYSRACDVLVLAESLCFPFL